MHHCFPVEIRPRELDTGTMAIAGVPLSQTATIWEQVKDKYVQKHQLI